MKVSEAIKLLQTLPQDAELREYSYENGDFVDVHAFDLDETESPKKFVNIVTDLAL